jgi:signal transduction histidine kinase
MARRAIAPLTALAADAGLVSIATLNHRLATRGSGDQLDKVAEAFNDTLSRLERAVGDMRQFSSALAHELRTPLTALRGELELNLFSRSADAELKTRVASQIEEIDRLTLLINQLLTLARAESGEIPLARDVVDLAALARSVTEQLEPIARAKELDLLCRASERVVVVGDRGWLERCLLNLLDNALKYTPQGGKVQVLVARKGHEALVKVCDTGIGMSSDVIPHVFERFYRGDPARSSSIEEYVVNQERCDGRSGTAGVPGWNRWSGNGSSESTFCIPTARTDASGRPLSCDERWQWDRRDRRRARDQWRDVHHDYAGIGTRPRRHKAGADVSAI